MALVDMHSLRFSCKVSFDLSLELTNFNQKELPPVTIKVIYFAFKLIQQCQFLIHLFNLAWANFLPAIITGLKQMGGKFLSLQLIISHLISLELRYRAINFGFIENNYLCGQI